MGVDPSLSSSILASGWTSASFAQIVSRIEGFDEVWEDLVPGQSLSLLNKSSLKAAWKRLQEPSSTASSSHMQDGSSSAAHDGSWSEVFAPKLSSSAISALKKKFVDSFPSEVLNSDTMPSTRLLSLTHHHTLKSEYRWVPWKFRMSAGRADDMAMTRNHKMARLENLQLHALLVDEPPSLDISNQNMGLNAVRQMFEIHNYAWALAVLLIFSGCEPTHFVFCHF